MQEKRKSRWEASDTLKAADRFVWGVTKRADFDLPHLMELRTHQATTEKALAAGVARLRAEGATWADIGKALGTTREAAWQRYGKAKS